MANIRVDVNYAIKDGSEIVFRSPVDCSQITGLIVYYPGEDGNTTSKVFALADAHGNNVGDIDHLFAENVVVKVILDVSSGMAFVQNADTNAYIESTFVKTVNGQAPDENGNVEVEVGPDSGQNGNGLTAKEKSLMLTLFKNMLSQSNMSDTVNELEKIWTSGDTGEEEPDTPEESQTYTVVYYLDNVVSSNSATTIIGGSSFAARLEVNENYKLDAVTVTMGGIDVTETVYADNVIVITSVTGNIVINAVAIEESAVQDWEDGVPYEFTPIENEYFENGAIKQYTGWARTDYLPCAGVARLNFSGNKYRTGYNGFFDINKTYLGNFDVETTSTDVTVPENAAFFMYSSNSESVNLCVITPYASL